MRGLLCYDKALFMKKVIPEIKNSSISLGLIMHAIEASSCAITIADAQKKDMPLIYINGQFEMITGYKPVEVIGKNCRFLQGKAKNQAGLKLIRKALKEQKSCKAILENYTKKGDLFWNELHLAPVFDDAGKLTHYIGVQTNVTQRVNAESELDRYRDHLEHLVKERTQKLEEKNLALKEILSQIELEKKKIKDQVTENVDAVILPLVHKVKARLGATDQKYAELIQKNLTELTSSFGSNIARKLYKLTPREIEISNMIRSGLASKDIAQFFHVSLSTIENQRNAIRKKLAISKQEVNLASYLQSLTSDIS